MAGADAVLAHHPHDRPEKLKRGPAPLFHAATAEMRKFLWSLYAKFVGRFLHAAEKLRQGIAKPSSLRAASRQPCRSCLGEALPATSP